MVFAAFHGQLCVGGRAAWYLTNQLGTVRDIINSAGQRIVQLEYDSFGNVLSESNPLAGDRFKFTGREWDAELSLYYYRARFYDPALGRFLSQDPIGFAAGDSNLYRYVGNSPLLFVDPFGLEEVVAYPQAARVAASVAAGFAGLGVGFLCGYLQARLQTPPLSNGEATAFAARQAATAAVVSAGIGAATGAASGTAGVLLGGFFFGVGVGFQLMDLAADDNLTSRALKVACFVAEMYVGIKTEKACAEVFQLASRPTPAWRHRSAGC